MKSVVRGTLAAFVIAALTGLASAQVNLQVQPGPLDPGAPAAEIGPPQLPQAEPAPPPLPPRREATYYYERGGQPVGPVSLAELSEQIRQGVVTTDTLVWKSGTPNWVAAKDVQELAAVIAERPPPVPPEEQWRQFMVGTWEFDSQAFAAQGISQHFTEHFRPDGTFTGVITSRMEGGQPFTQTFEGRWKVRAISGERFALIVTMNGGQEETTELRRVDQNTVSNDAGGFQAFRTN